MYSTKQTEQPTPTSEQFTAYQALYEYFNQHLFGSALPSIILNFSRKSGSCGFFARDRWSRHDGRKTHEISINPTYLTTAPFIEIAQTLVHEQCHLWQCECGEPSRTGYHNREWADKMESIGLMPSSTGQPGGHRVGQHMSDYVIEGGQFEQAFNALPEALRLPWKANEATLPPAVVTLLGGLAATGTTGAPSPQGTATSVKTKVKYTCPGCKAKAWGKPQLNLICGDCHIDMKSPLNANLSVEDKIQTFD